MLFQHGWPKLNNFAALATSFADPLGVGSKISLALTVFSEAFCAAALIVGFLSRLATVPLLITMLVAAFIVHGADPFAKKEMALLYASGFLTLILTGPGEFAVDGLFKKKRPF